MKSFIKYIVNNKVLFSFVKIMFVVLVLLAFVQNITNRKFYNNKIEEDYYYNSINILDSYIGKFDSELKNAYDTIIKIYTDNKLMTDIRLDKNSTNGVENKLIINDSIKGIAYYSDEIIHLYGYTEMLQSDEIFKNQNFVFKYNIVEVKDAKGLKYCVCIFKPDKLFDEYFAVILPYEMPRVLFDEFTYKYDTELIVLDNKNNVFFGDNSIGIEKEYLDTYDKMKSQYKTFYHNHKKMILINRFSVDSGFCYYMLSNYNNITAGTSYVDKFLVLYVFLIVLIIVAVFAVFRMKEAYVPVRKNEEELKIYKNSIEKRTLFEYINFKNPSQELINKAKMLFQKMFDFDNGIILVYIEIDDGERFVQNNTSDWQGSLRYGIENVFSEIVSHNNEKIHIWDENDFILVAVSISTSEKEFCEQLELFKNCVFESLDLTVTTIVGKQCGFYELNLCYEDINRCKEYKYLLGNNSLIFCDKTGNSEADIKQIEVHKDKLLSITGEMDLNTKKVHISDYISEVRKLSINSARCELLATAYEIGNRIGNIINIESFSYDGILEKIIGAHNIDEVGELYLEIFKWAVDFLSEHEKNDNDTILTRIENLIAENYFEPAFCVDEIATRMGYSSVYLCRIFKKKTNRLLSEEILNYRLKKGMEMLINSDVAIKNIFSECGFSNYSHFCTIFKKKIGLSPGEFRKRKTSEYK